MKAGLLLSIASSSVLLLALSAFAASPLPSGSEAIWTVECPDLSGDTSAPASSKDEPLSELCPPRDLASLARANCAPHTRNEALACLRRTSGKFPDFLGVLPEDDALAAIVLRSNGDFAAGVLAPKDDYRPEIARPILWNVAQRTAHRPPEVLCKHGYLLDVNVSGVSLGQCMDREDGKPKGPFLYSAALGLRFLDSATGLPPVSINASGFVAGYDPEPVVWSSPDNRVSLGCPNEISQRIYYVGDAGTLLMGVGGSLTHGEFLPNSNARGLCGDMPPWYKP